MGMVKKSRPKPTKDSIFQRLVNFGVTIDTVVDVGVLKGTPELLKGFPKAKHFLFVPLDIYFDQIKINYASYDYQLFNVACSDVDGECFLVHRCIDGTGNITHSHVTTTPVLVGKEGVVECKLIKQVRLDSMDIPVKGNMLLKIDVDGVELLVLKGAKELLARTTVVVIEASLGELLERANYLAKLGFQLFDIVDLCYYYSTLSQVDLVFVRKDVIDMNEELNPWKSKDFSWREWLPHE